MMFVLAFGLFLTPSLAHSQTVTHHVVFALTSSDEADWKLTLGNIRNVLTAFEPGSTQVEVVAYGPGLAFVKKGSSSEQEITALIAKRVRFVACEHSMRMQHITAADLTPGVETVPSGVAEVVKAQERGWSYIKAGR